MVINKKKQMSVITDLDMDGITCNYLLKQFYKDQVVHRQFHKHGNDDFLDSLKVNDTINTLVYADCFPDSLFSEGGFDKLNNIKQVIILDHHISGYNRFIQFIKPYRYTTTTISGIKCIDVIISNVIVRYYFSTDYSATGIIYTIFNIKETEFLRFVNDNDIWQHKTRDNYLFGIGVKNKLKGLNLDPNKDLDRFVDDVILNIRQYVKDGETIYNNIERIVDTNMERGRYKFTYDKFGNRVLVCDFSAIDTNIQLQMLYNNYTNVDYVISYTASLLTGKVIVALRSRLDGGDCSVVASKMGGGGHVNAAGFSCTIDQFYAFLPTIKDNG